MEDEGRETERAGGRGTYHQYFAAGVLFGVRNERGAKAVYTSANLPMIYL